jgi:arylsulfatase A-like enzyme
MITGALTGIILATLVGFLEMILRRVSGEIILNGFPLGRILLAYQVPGALAGAGAGAILRLRPGARGIPEGKIVARIAAFLLAGVLLGYGWSFLNARLPGSPVSPAGIIFNLLLIAICGLAYLPLRRLSLAVHSTVSRSKWVGLAGFLALLAALVSLRLLVPAPDRVQELGGETGTRPNVILITVDALRYDHLSVNGYARRTSPNLDRLAREGVNFSQAISQATITIRSMTSLFTSLYPRMHGVMGSDWTLPEETPLMASIFSGNGYVTAAFTSGNTTIHAGTGLSRGFDLYDECRNLHVLLPYYFWRRIELLLTGASEEFILPPAGEITVNKALRFAEANRDRDLFLLVHLMDVHSPYHSPGDYDYRFGLPLREGRSDRELTSLVTKLTHDNSQLFFRLYKEKRFDEMDDKLRLENVFTEKELDRIIQLYDGGIAYADAQIARLLEGLDQIGILQNSVVVVTADHGEAFLEHGRVFHSGDLVYEELIRVPLILWSPSRLTRNRTVEHQVELVDLLPSLIRLADLQQPKGANEFVGRSLLPLVQGDQPPKETLLHFDEAYSEGALVSCVRTPRYKYIDCPGHARRELYDLQKDPGETRNLLNERPDVARDYAQRLAAYDEQVKAYAAAHPRPEVSRLTERMREELKALGYVE